MDCYIAFSGILIKIILGTTTSTINIDLLIELRNF